MTVPNIKQIINQLNDINIASKTKSQRESHIKELLNQMNALKVIPQVNQTRLVKGIAAAPTGNMKKILYSINQLHSKSIDQRSANISTILRKVDNMQTTRQKLNIQTKGKVLQRKQEVINLYNRNIRYSPELVVHVNSRIRDSTSIPNSYGQTFYDVMSSIK